LHPSGRQQGVARSTALRFFQASLLLLLPAATATFSTPQEADTTEPAISAAASGTALFDQGRCGEALEQLDLALAEGTRGGRLLYMAARCQKDTQKGRGVVLRTITEAMPLLEIAVTSGAADLNDYAFLADGLMLIGNEPSAKQSAAKGVAVFSAGNLGDMATMDALSLQRLGDMAILAQDWDVAAQALNKIVEQTAPNGEEGSLAAAKALSSLGTGQLNAGAIGEAVASLQRSLELNPDDPATNLTYARGLFHNAQYAEAADQWRLVRNSNAHLANDATYASMALRTLAQTERLQAPDSPLPDLTAASPPMLEQQMLDIAAELNAMAASLPPEMVKRGYAGREADESTRATMDAFRDQKLRLAWIAVNYVDRGRPLREFAFSRGLQGYLRDWRLPKDRAKGERNPLPLEWLNEKQRKEYLDRKAAQAEKRAERKKAEAEGS
jgi:hypothetical protein